MPPVRFSTGAGTGDGVDSFISDALVAHSSPFGVPTGVGVVEDLVLTVAEDHEIVFVEGQASLTHRGYSAVTLGVLHGSWPDAVVLADDPDRTRRTHFEQFPVDGVEREADLVEELSDATVAALSTWGDPTTEGERHGIPAVDVYEDGGPAELLGTVRESLQLQTPSGTTEGAG